MNYQPIHQVEDQDKLAALVASMTESGWVGAPIVVDGEQAITGSHRLAAAQIAEIEIETVELADLFADAEIDLHETAYELNYDLVAIVNQLPASVRAEYGIDLH